MYIGSQSWSLYALDGDRGTLKWSKETGGNLCGQPAISKGGIVCFGSDDEHLYALDGKTGEEVWKKHLGGCVRSSPVIDRDGMLYMPTEEKIVVMECKNGDVKGEVKTDNMFNHYPKPLIDEEGTIYSTSSQDVFAVTGLRKSREQTEKNYQKALEEAKKDIPAGVDGVGGGNSEPAPSAVTVDNGFIIIDGMKMEIKKHPDQV